MEIFGLFSQAYYLRKTVTAKRINCYLQIVFIFAKYVLNPIAQAYAFLIKLSGKNDAGMKINKFVVCFLFKQLLLIVCS